MQLTKRKFTPPEVARLFGVEPGKIIAWIRTGELRAINGATKRGQRPRYLIDVADIEAFERSRQVIPVPAASPRRKRSTENVVEFFK
ncbi:MAG: helix-turn-helix domain-containing protein [Planctomycetia bacterium]|nr:helix-turn-helix domain-containing protein [Planctomycetia bacterium]